ncbi:MAG TPA: glycosyltransferase family 9 protein [Verrucomicrobiae bacterium]|nr:glycosyltransferase family 9 protein [Verrucomicrobiae bacterium]
MKILVISLAGIGDTLFATPLLRELRANFPDATIDVLVMWAGAKDLLEHNPNVSRVFQKNLIKSGKFEAINFLRSLQKNNYDFSINTFPQSKIHYRIAAWLAGAKIRISHEYECFGVLDKFLVNQILPQDYSRHAVEQNLSTLQSLRAKQKFVAHELQIFLTLEEQNWANQFLAQNNLTGKKWLGVHVGSGGTKNLSLRRWPLENYIELSRRLQAEKKLPTLFFGGPEEAVSHETIRSQFPSAIFPPTKNIREAAALAKFATAFLTVDTALMHIAATMKVPGQIVIETPSWNKPIEPFGNPFTLVKNPAVAGRNLEFYRYDGGDIKGSRKEIIASMKSVSVESIFEVVAKLI